MSLSSHRLTRREFLKSLSITAVGMAAIPWSNLQKRFHNSEVEGVPLRVGVAIPSYLKDRKRARQWLKGLRLGLSEITGTTLIPYTADDRMQSVTDTLEELVKVGRADVIVGSVSPLTSTGISDVLAGTSAVFLNAEVGASLMSPSLARENVFHHTLHYWQANWATGTWAAQTMGKRGAILATFYEAGFDALAAFQLAFEQAGGEITRTIISHVPTGIWNPRETLSRLAALKPDFVYVMGVGEQAESLFSSYQNSPLNGFVPVLASMFAGSQGIPKLPLMEFKNIYERVTGENPDAIALLGYETGLLIHKARQMMAETGESLSKVLSTVTFASPRGQIQMDSETHSTVSTGIVDGEANLLPYLPLVDFRLARLSPDWSEIRTGWITPYFSL